MWKRQIIMIIVIISRWYCYLFRRKIKIEAKGLHAFNYCSLGTLVTWFCENNLRQETGRRERKKNMEQSGKILFLCFFTLLDISAQTSDLRQR